VPESQPPPSFPDLNALFGDLFGQFFSGRTQHLHATVAISDAEAASGLEKKIEIRRAVRCTTCDGRGTTNPDAVLATCDGCGGSGKRMHTQGFFQVQTTCPGCKGMGSDVRDRCVACEGHGTTLTAARVTVSIPAGAQHEQEIVLAGQGGELRDGARGDLTVRLLVGGRPDSRLASLSEVPPELASMFAAPLPAARIHQAKPRSRSVMPLVALAAGVLLLLVVLGVLR
jgi:molecular chaperone DnaJ